MIPGISWVKIRNRYIKEWEVFMIWTEDFFERYKKLYAIIATKTDGEPILIGVNFDEDILEWMENHAEEWFQWKNILHIKIISLYEPDKIHFERKKDGQLPNFDGINIL